VDPTTNRINSSGYSFDAAGNLTAMPGITSMVYDTSNRLSQATVAGGTEKYGYNPAGQRAWMLSTSGQYTVYFYGVKGELLATYHHDYGSCHCTAAAGPYVYFAGKKIWDGAGMVEDRLGSKVETSGASATSYYPYGELKSGTASQYATYLRNGRTGLDYAQQRWYSSQVMRFTSPDPLGGSASVASPQSWNRYSYVAGDPVNYLDRSGLNAEIPGFCPAEYSYEDCVSLGIISGEPGEGEGGGGVLCAFGDTQMIGGIPGPSCYVPFVALWPPPTKEPPTCGVAFFSTFGLISDGEQDAVSVLLGENSWNYMGTRQYRPGQRYGHGTGPLIGVEDVSLEDDYMADVILNRVSQWGGTLSSQASNTKAFNGYSAGNAMFKTDMSIPADTSQCSDLLVAFGALRSQEIGTRLNTSILFWGAVVDPKTGRAIAVGLDQFMVADTIFGLTQVYK